MISKLLTAPSFVFSLYGSIAFLAKVQDFVESYPLWVQWIITIPALLLGMLGVWSVIYTHCMAEMTITKINQKE